MSRKPKDEKTNPEPALPESDTQQAMAGRRLMVAHRRLKISFADAYVENTELREEIARLNEVMQEQQRVIREMSAKLPKDKPAPEPKSKKAAPKP